MAPPLTADLRSQRQEHAVNPKLDVVIDDRTERTAVDALQPTAQRMGTIIFVLAHRRPDAIDAFEIGASVVTPVVDDAPQTHRMGTRDESETRKPEIPEAAGNEAAMGSVMTDDEQHGDENAIGDGTGDGSGNRHRSERTGEGDKIERVMGREEPQSRSQRTLVVGRWIEGLGKGVRLIGNPRQILRHSCRSNHSRAERKIEQNGLTND